MATRVGADGEEGDLAEVEQAGVAEVHVEADGGEGEARSPAGPKAAVSDALEDQVPVHRASYPIRSARPEDALGPDEQDEDQHGERADVLQLGRDEQRRQLDEHADDERLPTRAP